MSPQLIFCGGNECQITQMKSWCSFIVFTVLLLILIFPRYHVKVKRATIAEKDISDDDIDAILWEFIGKWDVENGHSIGQFKSTMTAVLRLFAGIDSRKLSQTLFRIRRRLENISRALKEERDFNVNSTELKTEI